MNAFSADMASLRRILALAAAENRLRAFAQFAREGVRWHTDGNLPKPDVVDALRAIALEAGLNDVDVQAALEAAIDHPFVPRTRGPTSSNGITGTGSVPSGERAQLVIRRASEIEPQPVRWIWPGRLPLGKVTLIAGEPGLGKSQLTCAIAATVTVGGDWPFGEGKAPRSTVLMFSAEDDASDTIRPRLEAAGADLERVSIVSAVRSNNGKVRRSFSLQEDLPLLECEIDGAGDLALVVIDPVASYLGKVDSHRNSDLRAVLEPLGELAARRSFSVLAVTHFSKGSSGSANNRIIGSIAFVAAARAAHIVVRDRDDKDRRLFIPSKNNVGPEGKGLSFRTQLLPVAEGILAPAVVWEGTTDTSADDALAPQEKSGSAPAREAAEEFLRTVLADGPLPMKRIETEAKEAGLAWATVRRAKDTLGLTTSKTALGGGWVWGLPPGT